MATTAERTPHGIDRRRAAPAHVPGLSPRANRALGEEVREVFELTGALPEQALAGDRFAPAPGARPPEDPPHHRGLGDARLLAVFSLATLVVVGAIIALASGSWWVLIGVVCVHVVATLLVGIVVMRMATQPEHLSPGHVAQLEAEGVADPDALLNELVEARAGEARGATEVLLPGANAGRASAGEEPARAALEHRTAFTPAGGPTEPAGGEAAEPAAPRPRGDVRRAGLRLGLAAAALVLATAGFLVFMGALGGLL